VKKIVIRIFLIAIVLVACGSTPSLADGGSPGGGGYPCKPPIVCLAR